MLMAMARWDYFWIANVIYLGFVLWAVAGSGEATTRRQPRPASSTRRASRRIRPTASE